MRELFHEDGTLKMSHELTYEQQLMIDGFQVIKDAKVGDWHLHAIYKVRLRDRHKYVEMLAKHFCIIDHLGKAARIDCRIPQ
jgi:hypothetical protein